MHNNNVSTIQTSKKKQKTINCVPPALHCFSTSARLMSSGSAV